MTLSSLSMLMEAHYTPKNLKRVVSAVCKARKEGTGMVYTRAFRAYALEAACRYVREVPQTMFSLTNLMEALFSAYEEEQRQPVVPTI